MRRERVERLRDYVIWNAGEFWVMVKDVPLEDIMTRTFLDALLEDPESFPAGLPGFAFSAPGYV